MKLKMATSFVPIVVCLSLAIQVKCKLILHIIEVVMIEVSTGICLAGLPLDWRNEHSMHVDSIIK